MSSYSELIKNFENMREIMREFYVYGFKSREEYNKKSTRSYDDNHRRIESWLGEYMKFVRTPEGKNVFISIDSRVSQHNPFYKTLKAKSFTDGDITFHFILFDILYSSEVVLSVYEIIDKMDEYLSEFENPMVFDESTVRKKLKEYAAQGIIIAEKYGRKMMYKRAKEIEFSYNDGTDVNNFDVNYSDNIKSGNFTDVLNFFSEVAPCGVIGSFLLDKQEEKRDSFNFKHHYITSAMDTDVLALLFKAMREKSVVTVNNFNRKSKEVNEKRVIPLRIFISVQNGRQYLIAYQPDVDAFKSLRIDHLSNVKIKEPTLRFDELREELDKMQLNMWGVTIRRKRRNNEHFEHIEFTVKTDDNEGYILRRLQREKRCGKVEKINDNLYRFTADVYDVSEMIPWIRTFICRITEISFSNKRIEKQFKADINKLYQMYGVKGDNYDF